MLTHAEVLTRLESARARCEAATEGPWTMCDAWGSGEEVNVAVVRGAASEVVFLPNQGTDIHGRREDFKWMAAARTDLPAALDAMLDVARRHEPSGIPKFCLGCDPHHHFAEWPCPDFAAVAAAAEKMLP